jgi:hypothetical protein
MLPQQDFETASAAAGAVSKCASGYRRALLAEYVPTTLKARCIAYFAYFLLAKGVIKCK